MQYRELILLLPCHSLEDFPTYHEGAAANGLLAAWSALWHPALIANARRTPIWCRADEPPEDVEGKLLVVPEVSRNELPPGFLTEAQANGAIIVSKFSSREELIALLLAPLGETADWPLARDFLAMSTCYLVGELLTLRMRYISHLDSDHFHTKALAAAEAAAQNDEATALGCLRDCYDTLADMRGHYYGVDAYLLELTLVAPTTFGQTLREQLLGDRPVNLLLSGQTLELMAEQEPETLQALRQAISQKTASIAGGEYSERELSLLSPEEILAELRHGLACYEKHLGIRPRVFARRRFGLSPVLPQILTKLGFEAALHFTLDDGRFPTSKRSKCRWEGLDGSAIDALLQVPLDASRGEALLTLPEKLGNSMDHDMIATVCFAHWPGQTSCYFDDLHSMTKYTPVLGRFATLDAYIQDTTSSGMISHFKPDEYRPPYLQQAIMRQQPDPITSLQASFQQSVQRQAAEGLDTLTSLLQGQAIDSTAGLQQPTSLELPAQTLNMAQARFSATMAGPAPSAAASNTSTTSAPGYLVSNPCSFTRVMPVAIPELNGWPERTGAVKGLGLASGPITGAPISGGSPAANLLSDTAGDQNIKTAMVEVPAMGFAFVSSQTPELKPAKPMVSEFTLGNEFFEVAVNPETGMIQSVHEYRSRTNRFSQQLAFRLPDADVPPGEYRGDPDDWAVYSTPVADSVEVTSAGPPLAEIVSRGRLLAPGGKLLSGFRQTTQIWQGSPVIRLEIELDIAETPRADPWHSYYAARFAWNDPSADIVRNVSQMCCSTELRRFESPEFVEIQAEAQRITLLTPGLPYHRRFGMRMLDTMLVARGETRRTFQLGIGIDLPTNAVNAAIDFNLASLATYASPTSAPLGWLMHTNAKNVTATHWRALTGSSGQLIGFAVRLLETQGHPVRAQVQSFRKLDSARQVDFLGNSLGNLIVQDDRVEINLGGYEWAEIQAFLLPPNPLADLDN